jgi:hypothetical protein
MRRAVFILAVVAAFSAFAEQKNVKLLTGLTDTELQRTMNMMRASLGTHCDYCHVGGETWDFASDEKPQKQRAREMIRMVMDVNRGTFNGNATISCYTCHRGAIRPVSLVPLPQAPPPFPTPLPEQPVLPDAKSLVAKYAIALGDVSRLHTRNLAGESTKTGNTVTINVREKGTKVQQVLHLPKGDLTQTFDGTSSWSSNGETTGIMTGHNMENFRALAEAFAIVLPSEIGDDAQTITKEQIGMHDTWVVQRTLPNGLRRKFYFDHASGLLVRTMLLVPRTIGVVPQQTDFEDYRDVGGTKFPFLVRVALVDPWTGATRQYKTVELGASIDDAVFAMPK